VTICQIKTEASDLDSDLENIGQGFAADSDSDSILAPDSDSIFLLAKRKDSVDMPFRSYDMP
jgi:hypothetical protein